MAVRTGRFEGLEALLERRDYREALLAAETRLNDTLPSDAEARCALHRIGLRAAHFLRDRETAYRHALEARRAADATGDPAARARAHNDLAVLYGSDFLYDAALDELWHAVHLVEDTGDEVEPAVLNNLANVHVHLRRHDEAIGLLVRAVQGYEARGDEVMTAQTRSNLGRVQLLADRTGAAIETLGAALESQERLEHLDGVVATLGRLGAAHGAAGAPERARSAFGRALTMIEEGHGALAHVDVRRDYGTWALSIGDADTALTQLQAAVDALDPDQLAQSGLLEPLSRALEAVGRTSDALDTLRRHVRVTEEAERAAVHVAAQLRMLDLELGIGGEQEVARLRAAELQRANERLRGQAAEMERLSVTDTLTGLPNRRAIDARLAEELARWRRHGRPLVFALLDLDRFKDVNDRFGHDVGDAVLRRAADLIAGQVRTVDLVGRWGGEEFALLLPETSTAGAMPVLRRVLDALEHERWSDLMPDRGVTASIGVAQPGRDADPRALLRVADRRLFAAKRSGRGRIVADDDATRP